MTTDERQLEDPEASKSPTARDLTDGLSEIVGPATEKSNPGKEFASLLEKVGGVGKPQILYFSMDDCEACQEMAPKLDELAEKHKDEAHLAKFDFSAYDRKNPTIDQQMIKFLGVGSVPALVFVDKQGTIQSSLIGYAAENFSNSFEKCLGKARDAKVKTDPDDLRELQNARVQQARENFAI
jgi:thiol-disulfide isomerase/thioredoxin